MTRFALFGTAFRTRGLLEMLLETVEGQGYKAT